MSRIYLVDCLVFAMFAVFAVILLVGLALFVRWGVMESSARHECRASGRMVVRDGEGEWRCAPVPEGRP